MLFLLFALTVYSGEDSKKDEPPRIGNFALPSSQQPSALFGFVPNIVDKGEVQAFLFADAFVGKEKLAVAPIPGVLLGLSEDCSIYYNFPIAVSFRDDGHHSAGLEDFFIKMGYAFYNKTTKHYEDQAALITSVSFPTGSVEKNPPTGFGSPSFFLGMTYYRTMVDWIFFTGHGALLTTSQYQTKIGDQFLYQYGFGRNIPSPEGWIYAWMLEIDGQYGKKSRINGEIDPNSGGNFIYVTPSIWVSSKDIQFQFGISLPINQNLYGQQKKFDYALNFSFAWSFY
jgi:hypothetical protein